MVPYRTSDVYRARSTDRILPYPIASSNFASLQVFYETYSNSVSIVYAPVPERLQYATTRLEVLTDTRNSTALRIPVRKSRNAM